MPILLALIGMCLVNGCASLGELGITKKKAPEYNVPVGLYAYDTPERFYYAGSARLDLPDLFAFQLQQVLPFRTETMLRELFTDVVLEKAREGARFGGRDLPGYFEVKVVDLKYDPPDPGAPDYRAETEIKAEFKTLGGEVIWGGVFRGNGRGFPDPDIRLTRFGRDSAVAVEESFEDALYEMQDAIRASTVLKDYLRDYQERTGSLAVPPQS